MTPQPTEIFVAIRAAIAQAGALLVQYSFSIVGAFVLLTVGWIAARYLHRWALSGMQRIHGFDVTLAHFLANVIRYAVLVMVVVAVLGQFGVQTASILAALGAAGLAIGLALQGTLQNIAAGIMLLILRPFRLGETIEAGNVSGTVQEIGLFATELRTGDGLYLIAPNSTLWNTPVKNFSRLPNRGLSLSIVVPVDTDVRQADTVLRGIASRDQRVMTNPAPSVGVSEVTQDTLKLTLSVWTANSDYGSVSQNLAKSAKIALDQLRGAKAGPEPEEKLRVEQPPDARAAQRAH
jgi:small conductance mechanosensitive channel